jgi:hypothetical protein
MLSPIFILDRNLAAGGRLVLSTDDCVARISSKDVAPPTAEAISKRNNSQSLICSSLACSIALSLSNGPGGGESSEELLLGGVGACAFGSCQLGPFLYCRWESAAQGGTFVEAILLLLALLPTAESSVDAVHEASALLLRGFGLLLGVAAASEVLDVVHDVWFLVYGLWVVVIVGVM